MKPANVPHPRDSTPGPQIVPAGVAQADRAAGDGFAQLPRNVDARERFQLQRVAEEEDVARGGAARFGRRGARVVEQDARVRRIEPEDAHARVRA